MIAQPAAVAALLAADLSLPETGLALCVSAIVWSGLAGVVDGVWRMPLVVGAAAAVGVGLGLASGDERTFVDAIVVGGLVIALGITTRREAIAHVGGVLVSFGVAGHLAIDDVRATEPYVALVAAHLAIAGWRRRQSVATSSWIA